MNGACVGGVAASFPDRSTSTDLAINYLYLLAMTASVNSSDADTHDERSVPLLGVSLEVVDHSNLNELIPKIVQATVLYKEKVDREEKTGSGPGQYTGPFNSIPDLATIKVTRNENEPLSVALWEQSQRTHPNFFLENFGLSLENSLLWDS
ncbi:hypothetical protein F5Y19DRAFT_486480 [Xylariaceae sp. FL1651]|nr:hypothetical protein F5Y19DRAFT_486480 [Xylariaceae sp. FL1651]